MSGSSAATDPPIRGLLLAPMTEAHLDEVVEIERGSFASPWKREHFLHELHENRFAVNHVALRGDQVLGYTSVWRIYGELKINNIAVSPRCRRRGLGRWLLVCALDAGRRSGCQVVRLEVRVSNNAARDLYDEYGFVEIGRRKHYYQSEGEDAVLMELRLDEAL